METSVNQPQKPISASWRERALVRSEIITDAWEVTKTYAGRLAEWVLFLCMVMNIIEILPGVALWSSVTNVVLGTQVVMLDIGGFSLASMGDHARQQGNEKAANRATTTGVLLITIMIITLVMVSVGILWPDTRGFTTAAEKGLILVRVIMTVIYGHVIHSLRQVTMQHQQQTQNQQVEEVAEMVTQRMAETEQKVATYIHQLQAEIAQVHQHMSDTEIRVKELFAQRLQELTLSLENMLTECLASQHVSQQNKQETASTEAKETMVSEPRPSRRVNTVKSQKASNRKSNELASRRVQKALERFPGATQEFIAQKAGVSRSYVCKLVAEIAKKTTTVEEEGVAK